MTAWMVTTRHTDRWSVEGRVPWGTRHARRDGDAVTACGLSTRDWAVFWHLPFLPTVPHSCPDCLEQTAGVRTR